MLEQFHVPEDSAVRVSHTALLETAKAMFERVSVPHDDARIAADALVRADLRGVDSHGVSNMLRTYLSACKSGVINPQPNIKVLCETPATANLDSDRGLGVVAAPKAMEMAISKAKDVGVGMVTVCNGRHLGMASYHAMMALEHDMIGVCVTTAAPRVVPTFGAVPRMGTNPIAVAAPAKREPPFVFDAATSVISGNKITIAHRLGTKLLGGWVPDDNGVPIMEEVESPTHAMPAILPLGSTREMSSHKGYGLACVVDILSGILSGGGYGIFPGRPYNYHMVAAYRIDAFTDVDGFKGMMDEFLQTLKETPPAPGYDRVLVPGQPEWEMEQDRLANGIPLHEEVIQWFRRTCKEMGIPYVLE